MSILSFVMTILARATNMPSLFFPSESSTPIFEFNANEDWRISETKNSIRANEHQNGNSLALNVTERFTVGSKEGQRKVDNIWLWDFVAAG